MPVKYKGKADRNPLCHPPTPPTHLDGNHALQRTAVAPPCCCAASRRLDAGCSTVLPPQLCIHAAGAAAAPVCLHGCCSTTGLQKGTTATCHAPAALDEQCRTLHTRRRVLQLPKHPCPEEQPTGGWAALEQGAQPTCMPERWRYSHLQATYCVPPSLSVLSLQALKLHAPPASTGSHPTHRVRPIWYWQGSTPKCASTFRHTSSTLTPRGSGPAALGWVGGRAGGNFHP